MRNCEKCGAELARGALVCNACGAAAGPLPPAAPDAPPPQSESERRMALFVGEKYPVYAAKWARMAQKRRAISWNWAAAILFVGWLGYRGLHRIAYIVIGLDMVEFAIEGWFELSNFVSGLFSLAIGLAVALNANRWYRQYAERRIAAIVATTPAAAVDAEIARAGAPSWKAGVGLALLWALALLVAAFAPELRDLIRG